MEEITGDIVWAVLQEDMSFLFHVPEPARRVYEEFAKAMPEILADLLDEVVTLETLAKAQAAFTRYCLENGFVDKFILAIPDDLRLKVLAGIANGADAAMRQRLAFMQAVADSPETYLEILETTEASVIEPLLLGENVGPYMAGRLTIADLIMSQPYVIARNKF